MRRAFVLVGPRGAGKSTTCHKMSEYDPTLKIISRDVVYMRLFKATEVSPYDGSHEYGHEVMWRWVGQTAVKKDVSLVLDCYNSYPAQRRDIAQQLRKKGFRHITAWYLTTPAEVCWTWFRDREHIDYAHVEDEQVRKMLCGLAEATYHDAHADYHRMCIDLPRVFDGIVQIDARNIDPAQLLAIGRTKKK